MCPGCNTTLGTPPASVSRCSSASMAALPMPYSPYPVRGSSSVTGTLATRPCTQILHAVQEKRASGPQRIDELLGGLRSEADQVDNRVRPQARDQRTERPGRVACISVGAHPLHRPPLHRLLLCQAACGWRAAAVV